MEFHWSNGVEVGSEAKEGGRGGGEEGVGRGREAGGRGGGGCTKCVHDRSRMTIDPRIPVMPGRSTSGFRQPGRHCLHHARSAVEFLASRMKGELHPS